MKKLTIEIQGVSPLMMHNGQMANPLSTFAKQMASLTGIRKKQAEHHEKISKLEFVGALYTNEKGEIIVPADCLEATFINGAKKHKLGMQAKSGMLVEEDSVLEYVGPKDPEELYNNKKFVDIRAAVVNGKARIMRTRPIFPEWKLKTTILYDSDLLSEEEVLRIVNTSGQQVGLLEYRPRYGRFTVVKTS
jgi:hypothetical protein